MKKILIILALMAIVFVPLVTLADGETSIYQPESIPEGGDVFGVINTVGNYLFGALILFALFFLIMASFKLVTRGDDKEERAKAFNQILYAVIGIVIALLSRGIIALVRSIVNPVG